MTSLLASAVLVNVSAQWLPGTGIITTTNKVGVGNTTPNNPLSVKGTGTGTVEVGQVLDAATTPSLVNGAIGFNTGVALTRKNSALWGNQTGTIINAPTTAGSIFFRVDDGTKCTLNNNGFNFDTYVFFNKFIDANDYIGTRKGLHILNKAGNNWVNFATRNITGSEAKFDLSNINNMAVTGTATVTNLTVTGASTFGNTLSSTGLYGTSTAGKNIIFGTGANAANAKMTITEAGNVGIGTNTPTTQLEIYKTDNPYLMVSSPMGKICLASATCDGCFANGAKTGDAVLKAIGNTQHILFNIANFANNGNAYVGFNDEVNGVWCKFKNNKEVTIDGKVGIGTETPQAKLDVAGDIDAMEQINIKPTGDGKLSTLSLYNWTPGQTRVNSIISQVDESGIEDGLRFVYSYNTPGGWYPKEMMRVSTAGTSIVNNLRINPIQDQTSSITLNVLNPGALYVKKWDIVALEPKTSDAGLKFVYNVDNPGGTKAITAMSFSTDGSVGIGTENPDAMLTVNGTIHAKEVLINLDGPLADYVFDKNYKLMDLKDVESYVNEHSHLPEVPSASEVANKGMSLGEMQNKMLQKIEELTLYVIKQQKEIDELKKK